VADLAATTGRRRPRAEPPSEGHSAEGQVKRRSAEGHSAKRNTRESRRCTDGRAQDLLLRAVAVVMSSSNRLRTARHPLYARNDCSPGWSPEVWTARW
jgi:hypothetical protein